MNTCPVYRRSGGHSYEYVIPGPIGSILGSARHPEAHNSLPFACTLCGSYGVYARRYDANGLSNDNEFRVNAKSDGVSEMRSLFPKIFSSSDSSYIIIWKCYVVFSQMGLLGRRYNADNQAILIMDWGGQWVSEFFLTVTDIVDTTYSWAYIPIPIHGIFNADGWLVSFGIPTAPDLSAYLVFMQFYQERGKLVAHDKIRFNEEFRVNTYFLSNQGQPKIVRLFQGKVS